MTSQVVLRNSHSVAVASDTIATNSNGRALQYAKLIALDLPHRVAIAIRGPVRLMGAEVPVLLHAWLHDLDEPLDSLDEYALSFKEWLVANGSLEFNVSDRELVLDLVAEFARDVERAASSAWNISPWDWDFDYFETKAKTRTDAIVSRLEHWAGRPARFNAPNEGDYASLLSELEGDLRSLFMEIFVEDLDEEFPEDSEVLEVLAKLPEIVLTRELPFDRIVGIFFVGFGGSDRFPQTYDMETVGVLFNEVIGAVPAMKDRSKHFESEIVVPAQGSAIHGFLRGLDSSIYGVIREAISDAVHTIPDERLGISSSDVDYEKLSMEIWNHTNSVIREHSRNAFVDKILDVISIYTDEALASMAESLVGIQSLRSESHEEHPTVGGAIDVLTITRHQGCTWVKRRR